MAEVATLHPAAAPTSASLIASMHREWDRNFGAADTIADPMDLTIEEARPIVAWTMYRLLSLRIHKPARLLYPSLSFPIDPMPQPDPAWPGN